VLIYQGSEIDGLGEKLYTGIALLNKQNSQILANGVKIGEAVVILEKQDSEIDSTGYKIGLSTSSLLIYQGSEIEGTGDKLASGEGILDYQGSVIVGTGGIAQYLIYQGSEIVATGIKINYGSGLLIYGGSDIKGFGQGAGPCDALTIYFEKNGQPFDPFSVRYTIYDPCGNIVRGQENREADWADIGSYYALANFLCSPTANSIMPGIYKIVWMIQETYISQLISKANTFSVYHDRREGCQIRDDITSTDGEGQLQSGTCNTPEYGDTTTCGCQT